MSLFYCPKIFIKTIDTVGDNDYKKKGIYVVREKYGIIKMMYYKGE